MNPDTELFTFTSVAAFVFALIAIYFGAFVRKVTGSRRLKPPHPVLTLVFRVWFGVLAAGALYLTLFGRAGLFHR